jgi:hypothetical protein
MSRLESILEEARKLPLEERRQLAARLLEDGDISSTARQDEKLEAMRAAASDELFLGDLTATTEEWEAALDDFADSPAFSKAVSLVDDSRESIYREREDSQL